MPQTSLSTNISNILAGFKKKKYFYEKQDMKVQWTITEKVTKGPISYIRNQPRLANFYLVLYR